MSERVLLIEGCAPDAWTDGELNRSLVEQARQQLEAGGRQTRVTRLAEGWEVEREIARHRWADALLLQFPLHWMGLPWIAKKYLDEVYSAGMDGRLSDGDGRSRRRPARAYGTGGRLDGRRYLLSLSCNTPPEAFGDPRQPFFRGATVDQMLLPVHLSLRFLGLRALPSFVAYDVHKNPQLEHDFARFAAHLAVCFPLSPDGPTPGGGR